MIARRTLDKKYIEWNKRWSAPYGKTFSLSPLFPLTITQEYIKEHITFINIPLISYLGPFSLKANSSTRTYEYPWAFYVTKLEKGMNVVEIGGGLSGLQFVLSKTGLNVTNVDPGNSERHWQHNFRQIEILNKAFGTDVKLITKRVKEAKFENGTIDRVFCISVIEHLSEAEISSIFTNVYKILKKGGYFILTVDLFLDLFPFTHKKRNKWGTNVAINTLIKNYDFELYIGEKSELFGFEEFQPKEILEKLPDYYMGSSWPVIPQLLVLRKV